MSLRSIGQVITAGLFLAGICIGIAYFSIPILTGIAGFIPGALMTFMVWIFSLAIGLLYAEATLTQPDGSNLASISHALLGRVCMIILSIVFCINLITYLASYAYFTAEFFQWFFEKTFHISLSPFTAELFSTLPFCLIVFLGVQFSMRLNALLVIGLLIAFILMCYQGSATVVSTRLLEQHWTYTIFSVPILFSALGFVGIVPVLCTYLDRSPTKIRITLVLGTTIPFILYIFWQWFMLGSFPVSKFWVLYEEGANSQDVISLVQIIPQIQYFLNFTLFFSMATSLIGNGVAIVEFFSDLLHIPLKNRTGLLRLGLCCIAFGLILLAGLYKGEFFISLIQKFTAPLGSILINGMIPVFMVIQTRYLQKLPGPRILGGGTFTLFALGLCLLILIYLEGVGFISSQM